MSESRTLCVNKRRYFHRFIKQEHFSPIDLLAWLNEQEIYPKCYWQGRDGKEVAAVGSLLTLYSIPCFDRDNDSPARFWGGKTLK